MSNLSEAFQFIVPKYYYHSNRSFMVIGDEYEIHDLYEPQIPPCSTDGVNSNNVTSCYPTKYHNSPTISLQADFPQLPPVQLPYNPPANLKYPYVPAFDPIYSNSINKRSGDARYCSFVDTCDNICYKNNKN